MSESQAIYQMRITPGMEYIRGPEGCLATQEVLKTGKERTQRIIINLVGKERQGKTSLRKMLTGEEFDALEESTVGVEQDLVETVGVRAEGRWATVDIQRANEEEFDIVLGTHVLRYLKRRSKKWSCGKVVAPFMCFLKIAAVIYLSLTVYLFAASFDVLDGYPWFAVIVIGMFCGTGLAFGAKEGFGIAIGIFHQLLLCESLSHWKVETVLTDLQTQIGFTCALFSGFIFYAILESIAALSFGMSLGVGIAFLFCVASPSEDHARLDLTFLMSPYVHVFILGCYVGLGFLRYSTVLFFIVVPVLATAVHLLPHKVAFLLMCGIGCGHFHGIFLEIGQNTYYLLNANIERIASQRWCKRYIRHCVGFVPGGILLKVFDWNIRDVSMLRICIALFLPLTIELVNRYSSKSSGERNPSKVLTARVKTTSLKLVFRDFAGHPLYYSANHLYMTGHVVYVLVFNLLEARNDFDASFASIRDWLYSIHVHSRHPHLRVFIVGTHRDDPSLNSSVIKRIGEQIKNALTRKLHKIVVWNENDLPIFPVENSIRIENDPGHLNLKKRISREVKGIDFKKFPVKYFYLYTLIGEFKRKKILIKKYDEVFTICQENECHVKTHEEFDELLNFFAQTGEILHFNNDNILREFVIFDPQAVVNILSHLVTVPRRCEQQQDLMVDWHLLETFGICSEKLFKKHMSGVYSFDEFEKTMYVLERLNLLCNLQCNRLERRDRYYLIPALLPNELPLPHNIWQDEDDDYVFYIQALPALPRTAFLKLLGNCAAFDANLIGEDNEIVLNASQKMALFTYEDKFSYKLETVSSSGQTCPSTDTRPPVQQSQWDDLLRVVIRCQSRSDHLELLNFLWGTLRRIVDRDFPRCSLKLGIRCPYDAPHHDISTQSDLHILPLTEKKICEESGLGGTFWCRGRVVTVRDGRVYKRQTENKLTSSSLLSKLPYSLSRRVCDCLNIPSALGNDWTGLAGLLGKTSREVELLRVRCPGYPCEALLLDWVSSEPNTTVSDLVTLLRDMQRYDAITELGIK